MSKTPVNTLPIDHDDEPRPSLISFLKNAESFQKACLDLPEEVTLMHPRELEARIRKINGGTFDRTLGLLKIQFWDEYRRSCISMKPMKIQNICHGVCSDVWFFKFVQLNQFYLAWLIRPPTDEMLYQREILQKSLAKISDAIDAPLYDLYTVTKTMKNGDRKMIVRKKLNVSFLREVHSIFKSMSDRVHGAVVQRQQIESKNLVLQANATQGGLSLNDPNLTLDQLEAFQKKLQDVRTAVEETIEVSLDGETEDPAESEASSDTDSGTDNSRENSPA